VEAATVTTTRQELKSAGYEAFMILVSLLSILNTMLLVTWSVFGIQGAAAQQVLLVMDLMLFPLFLFDFLYRFLTASSRHVYMVRRWGWADLVAAVPGLGVFRIFRVVRVVRLLRAEGRDDFIAELVTQRATATFLFTIFLVLVVVELAGTTIFWVESRDPTANIKTASDAIWWGLVTITTVGYGDRYPVTGGGRVIGVLLLFAGIGLFSVLTGFIANAFLTPRRRPLMRRQSDDPRFAIEAVRELLAEQEQRNEEIRRRLDELERAVTAGRAPEGG